MKKIVLQTQWQPKETAINQGESDTEAGARELPGGTEVQDNVIYNLIP